MVHFRLVTSLAIQSTYFNIILMFRGNWNTQALGDLENNARCIRNNYYICWNQLSSFNSEQRNPISPYFSHECNEFNFMAQNIWGVILLTQKGEINYVFN